MTSDASDEPRRQPSVARVYSTDAIEVTWEPEYCIHFGACFRGSIRAFDPQRRPWVDASAERPERIAEIVSHCPTGALNARRLDEASASAEPEGPLTVTPQRDGPLFVRGPLRILDRQGNVVREPTRAALCRCGHSANKPFCDDSHYRVGFSSDDAIFDGG